ncbi:MAG TPA: hypothetical protein VGS12_17275 [Caulobacteraceae bacterium]|nr:hypothetical protein [Caulobacteraceae bacterium]
MADTHVSTPTPAMGRGAEPPLFARNPALERRAAKRRPSWMRAIAPIIVLAVFAAAIAGIVLHENRTPKMAGASPNTPTGVAASSAPRLGAPPVRSAAAAAIPAPPAPTLAENRPPRVAAVPAAHHAIRATGHRVAETATAAKSAGVNASARTYSSEGAGVVAPAPAYTPPPVRNAPMATPATPSATSGAAASEANMGAQSATPTVTAPAAVGPTPTAPAAPAASPSGAPGPG